MTFVRDHLDTSSLDNRLRNEAGLGHTRWDQLTLNREARRLSRAELVNKGVARPNVGFTWNASDRRTESWIPQGIAGLRIGDQRKYVVVSWYGVKDAAHKGVRLSFADVTDMDRVRYRHALLVEPTGNDRTHPLFQPVVRHAGGLAARDNTIFMVDTNYGVRVFDATRMFRAEADPGKTRCGLMQDGRVYAFDYRYILPQLGRYELDQAGTRFSFCTLDWSDASNPRLLTGNYHVQNSTDSHNPPAMLAWWKLAGARIVDRERTAQWDVERVQGAQAIGELLFASRSGPSHSLLVGRADDFPANVTRFDWPRSCEDLHYSPHSGNLWCLTEGRSDPGLFVFAVRAAELSP